LQPKPLLGSGLRQQEKKLERRLFRSSRRRVFLGICGGLGEYLNIDPVVIRVIAVIVTMCTGIFPGLIAYFIIALIVPAEGSTASTPEQSFRENVADIKNSSTNLGQGIRSTFENQPPPKSSISATPPTVSPNNTSTTGLIILGVVLLCIGVFFILENFLHWFWRFSFPAALVLAGLVIIVVVVTRRR
jgi:phage shock protein C